MTLQYDLDGTSVERATPKWYLLEGVDNRVKWTTIIFFFISLGMLIAGSVMLGIGISNNNQSPVVTTSTGYTAFLTVQSKNVPYAAVVNDYSGSIQKLTDQLRNDIGQTNQKSSMFAAENNIPITILGISDAGGAADVMYALSYTYANKPTLSDLQSKITSSNDYILISAIDATASSLGSMECAVVSASGFSTVTVNPITNPTINPSSTVAAGSSTPQGSTSQNPGTFTPVTERIRTTTTPFIETEYSRDIIILLDDSQAMDSPKNFNNIKSWIVNNLIPLWVIDEKDVQVAFATFASTEFNLLLDFDENNADEVTTVISTQTFTGKYNSSITNGIRSSTSIVGLRPVNQTTILISASENLEDIESATQYAYKINTLPKQLITVTLNSTSGGKQLGLLSTSQNHYFGSGDFELSNDTAKQITEYMFGISSPTTLATTTTTAPDNDCNADITIIIDCSNDVGSDDEYKKEVSFIRSLIKTWSIAPETAEGQAIMFSSVEGGMVVENAFNYQSSSAFANELLTYSDYYFAASPPSISDSLAYLASNLFNRRKNREQTSILFTYSSNNSDVQNSVQYSEIVGGNLVIVGLGKADVNVLSQLSGNVIYTPTYSDDLITKINDLLCKTSTRAPIVTTTTIITTPSTNDTSTTAYVSTAAPITKSPTTSVPLPDPCPDCLPKTSNILFLLEAFGDPLTNQKQLVGHDLIKQWNHFERVSVIGFDTIQRNLDPINFGDLQNSDEFATIVDNFTPFTDKPIISSAFNIALTRAQPLSNYGKMNSVIFTSGATADDIAAAVANSQLLRQKGKVIIVGIKLDATNGLEQLCDTLLKWDDLSNNSNISASINQALNN